MITSKQRNCYFYTAVLFPIIWGIWFQFNLNKGNFKISSDIFKAVPYKESVNISITGKNITYGGPGGNELINGSVLYLKPADQGIMLKTADLKVWNTGIQFSSLPANQAIPQAWFTKQHTHLKEQWGTKWYESLPGYTFFKPFKVNPQINRQNLVQFESGVTWIKIDATNNTADSHTTFQLQAVVKVWSLTGALWLELIEAQVILGVIFQLYKAFAHVYGPLHIYGSKTRYFTTIRNCTLLFYSLFKDVFYLFFYPHDDGVTACIVAACVTGTLYMYIVRVANGRRCRFSNLLFQRDLEGKELSHTAQYLMWEYNVWLIGAMLVDSLCMGSRVNFFQKSSILLSSIMIIQGHSNYVNAWMLDERIWNKNMQPNMRGTIIQTIVYIGIYIYIIGRKFHLYQENLYTDGFVTKQQNINCLYKNLIILAVSILIIGIAFYFWIRKKLKLGEDRKDQEMQAKEILKETMHDILDDKDLKDDASDEEKIARGKRYSEVLLPLYRKCIKENDDLMKQCNKDPKSLSKEDQDRMLINQVIRTNLLPYQILNEIDNFQQIMERKTDAGESESCKEIEAYLHQEYIELVEGGDGGVDELRNNYKHLEGMVNEETHEEIKDGLGAPLLLQQEL